MTGRTLSHYTLLGELGRGGMGVVYRALDTALGREVALKVLLPEFVADPERRVRFLHEAKAAAALEHPHIAAVYEAGEADGSTFIAMQLIRGERLRDVLRRGPMPIGRAVDVARELAEGLAAAHDKGIAHRDLTPGNVIVADDGHPKIIDFGLAKLLDRESDEAAAAETRHRTATGLVMGTAGYMSPEQAQGKPADHRADVFAFGAVLFEMLSAEAPFRRDSDLETIHAIITAPAPPVRLPVEGETASELRRIVQKCLAKDPRDRYQTMRDLVVDLRDVGRRLEPSSAPLAVAPASPVRRRRLAAIALAALVVTALAGSTYYRSRGAAPPPAEGRPRIAVMPFQNLGAPEDEYFAAGITEEITGRLAGVSQVAVISRNSAARYGGTDKTSQQVGRELGADYVLHGSVRWQAAGEGPARVRVTPQLVRVDNDTQVWAESYDRRFDEIFTVQSDIAARVIEQLGAAVLTPERRALDARPTENLQAYEAYLRGAYLFYHQYARAGRRDALLFFERSVALDPAFARGQAAVAIAAAWRFFYVEPSPEWEAKADAAIEKALALDPNLADAYLARANLLWTQPRGFPHERAIRDLRRALALNPSSAEARVALGRVYVHVGLLEEAREELTAALQLDPANEEAPARLYSILEFEHDFAKALADYDRQSSPSPWAKVEALSRLGRDDEALALATQLTPEPWVSGVDDLVSSRHYRVVVLARLGLNARADALLPGLEAVARNPQGLSHLHHAQYSLAQAHALRGRPRQAVEWLRKAAAEGFPCYPYFAKDPNLGNLKGDAEFEALMAALKTQWERLRVVAQS
jgi:TolB-like protein/predicted Ser/Thr protein kinase